eukprot:4825490-Lingulodinium_polyedra.AAC.1
MQLRAWPMLLHTGAAHARAELHVQLAHAWPYSVMRCCFLHCCFAILRTGRARLFCQAPYVATANQFRNR